jgi:endoglycosylceramidase
VAERFRASRHVLGYDLLNEPWPGTAWQQCANPAGCPAFDAQLSAFNERMLAAIRTVDPDTLVFYEPQVFFNNGALTNMADTGDAHTAMSFHDYCVTAGEGGGGYEGCEPLDEMVFQNADDRAQTTGDALLLTEFGATDQPDVLLGVLGLADRHMVGWQEWHYCGCDDPTTTGSGDKQAIVLDPAKPPAGANLKKPTVDLLARPYPRAVAGTPKAWSFDDATRRFTLTYTRKRASGHGSFRRRAVTEVVVPKRRYRRGYRAKVRGGKRVSRRGARVLRIRARKHAKRVKVTLAPRRR